eukprot:scaffold29194_cov122-Isochrysis_galbana.AAC.2
MERHTNAENSPVCALVSESTRSSNCSGSASSAATIMSTCSRNCIFRPLSTLSWRDMLALAWSTATLHCPRLVRICCTTSSLRRTTCFPLSRWPSSTQSEQMALSHVMQ